MCSEKSEERCASKASLDARLASGKFRRDMAGTLPRVPVGPEALPVSVQPPVETSICIHGYRYPMVCLTSIRCRYSRVLVLVACPETDASGSATGGALLQKKEDRLWHPVAYRSESMIEAERNYEIYDREMLGIVRALED